MTVYAELLPRSTDIARTTNGDAAGFNDGVRGNWMDQLGLLPMADRISVSAFTFFIR